MQDSQQPVKFLIGFASSAGGAYIRPIPTASQIGIQNGAASLTDGFPPLCFLAESAGGVPPFGEDFNGLLNQVTLWCQWVSAGSPAYYDSAFSAAIGGYPKGAKLNQSANPQFFWVSLVDNNASNPDAAGANWYDTSKQAVGGVLTGTLPNPGMASGAAAANVGALGGSLTGTLPNPGIANSGVSAASYVGTSVTVGADGRVTAAANATYPTYQTLKSGSGATYTTPAGAKRLKVRMAGGGGSGVTTSVGGAAGTQSAFGSTTALPGGPPGTPGASAGGSGGSGGVTGTGTEILRLAGGPGGGGSQVSNDTFGQEMAGGNGGNNPFGGAGMGGRQAITSAVPNTGAGGAGQNNNGNGLSAGAGGGAGEYVEFVVNNPAGSYIYTVGLGGTAPAGAGNGATGVICVEEWYY